MKRTILLALAVLFSIPVFSQTVGIGTNTPNASAALDVVSTSKGLLPPRMTVAERDAIVNPAVGLFIYCTDCTGLGVAQIYNGLYWLNMTISEIGYPFQGGIIAYVLVPGDPGYDPNVPHGLIAAPFDQSPNIDWLNGTFLITGASGVALGTGLSNTTAIVNSQGIGDYAARICYDLVLNGYSDWFLPSKNELNKLYLNRNAIGGFTTNIYWSSSEFSASHAWAQYFSNGVQDQLPKVNPYSVRAIRSF